MTQPDKPVPQGQASASIVLLLRRNDSRYARGEGAVRVQPHRDGGIRRDVLGDQLAGNQRFNVRLDEAIDGTRTVGGVKGLLDDALDSRVGHNHVNSLFLQPVGHFLQLEPHDLADIVARQRLVDG